NWDYPKSGIAWSLLAGIAGAGGAFFVLLAFGARGTPAAVMSIVFAGAPGVNALYSIWPHPPPRGAGSIKPQFYIGLPMATLGGCLVTYYKPTPPAARPPAPQAMQSANTPGAK